MPRSSRSCTTSRFARRAGTDWSRWSARSGAGKTTITHLVARLYDVTTAPSGSAAWTSARSTLEALRDAIGVVTQDAHMFHDTIRANLPYARPERDRRRAAGGSCERRRSAT